MNRTNKLSLQTTPIFTPEIGFRMRRAREKFLWTQADLAQKLGISQHQVSRLETGTIRVIERPFTLAIFQAVFGDAAVGFILFGYNKEKFLDDRKYWSELRKRAEVRKRLKQEKKALTVKLSEAKDRLNQA